MTTATRTQSPTELDRLLDDHYAAEVAGDLDALLATFSDEVEHDVVGNAEVSHGTEAVAAFYRGLLADLAFDDITRVRRYHGADFVVDESVVHARAIGTPFGLPGGGREIRFRLLHVFEVRDGRITRENAWIDLASVLAQLAR